MAEQAPTQNQQLPEDLSRFSALDPKLSRSGAHIVHGIDKETGKKIQIKNDDVLLAHGYSPEEAKDNDPNQPFVPPTDESPGNKIDVIHEPDTTVDSSNLTVRPVKEGELSEGSTDDDLSSAVMGSEPWTLDIEKPDDKTPENPENPTDPPVTEKPEDPDAPGTDIVPYDPNLPNPTDPYSKIGEVVNKRIDELKQGGMSEIDAHAQAHDEFWGKNPDAETPVDPENPEQPLPQEELTSPDLEAAKAALEEASIELARLKAGRESATFFSRKFSKNKLKAAEEAYKEAKANAGAIAVELLRENNVEKEQIVSAINWGSMMEVTSLIEKQYDLEREAVDSKRLKGFYSWWKDQGTKFFSIGTIKKGAVMAAVGVPIGLGAAIISAPLIAGMGVAAGAGLVIASRVSKGLVGNAVRRNAEASDVAEGKRIQRIQEAQLLINTFEELNRSVDEQYIDDLLHTHTTEVKHGNDRRAASSMAVAAGGALLGYMIPDVVDHFWPGDPKTPKIPDDPGNPKTYNPDVDRFRGLVTARPEAAAQTQEFFGNIQPGTEPLPSLEKIDEIWDSVKGQLSPQEDRVFNQVVGRLSTVEGYGNDWTVQHSNEIIDLVKAGNDSNQIIGLLGAGPQNL